MPMPRTKLLIVHFRHNRYKEYLEHAEPRLEITSFDFRDSIPFESHDAEILIGWKFQEGLLERLPRLRWISAAAAGVDNIIKALPPETKIVVTKAVATMGEFMADYVLTFVLAHLRKLKKITLQQREKLWRYVLPDLAMRSTLGIIGLGNIGSQIASKAKAIGMTVLAAKREPIHDPPCDRLYTGESWHEMLPLCDFVVLAVPHTKFTERMIGAAELSSMKPTAVMINISRGVIVDEAALLDALAAETIGGAVLDVFDEEPLPPEHPFWEIENVVVTPHCAGTSEDGPICDEFLENFERWLRGEPLARVADPKRGY